MASKSLLIGFISNGYNYEVFDGSLSDTPHKVVKTNKRRMPPRPPSPKPNKPISNPPVIQLPPPPPN
ncbi:hypothetical protein CR513_14952, partial [Mucuna pruriens]